MNKIEQLRNIVKDFSMREVEGVEIDVQTANAIVTVYDALGEENKEKFTSQPIGAMANIAWKLIV